MTFPEFIFNMLTEGQFYDFPCGNFTERPESYVR